MVRVQFWKEGREQAVGARWGLGEKGVSSISLGFSWFCYQGPRGLPGERGRLEPLALL